MLFEAISSLPIEAILYFCFISFNVGYGIYYTSAKVDYIILGVLFALLHWSIGIDYYTAFGIFTNVFALIIFVICGVFWHIIETNKVIKHFLSEHKDELVQEEMIEDSEEGQIQINIKLTDIGYFLGLLLYIPSLYMAFQLIKRLWP